MMKNKVFIMTLAGLLLGLGSCSQSELSETSNGQVCLRVSGSTMFSRAVDFQSLNNTDNYLVNIYDAQEVCVLSSKLGDITDHTVTLNEGAYSIEASYGEAKAASQNEMWLKGTSTFNVVEGEQGEVSVICRPMCAKVNVDFGEKMETYFSDYYVTYNTEALKASESVAVWAKTNTDPWYLQVGDNEMVKATIHVTRTADGKSLSIERERALSPAKSWTLKIEAQEPEEEGGKATLSITIDESTNDRNETITVPDDWWM